ncbi:MAG: porin [Halomonas sp.]|nr:porin [Halomonas sp.]TVM06001.1 MAG: porin [Halomonas sp.]
MKKTLLALAVSLASVSSAHAVTVYDNNGLTYEVNGDFQVQLRQKAGEDKDSDIEFDDLEIKNSVSYELNDDMTAFGQMDFDFKGIANDDDGEADLEEAYVGMAFNNIAVSVGKRPTAGDEFGVEKAIELDEADGDRFDAVATSGDDVIHVEADFDTVTLMASYEMAAKGSSLENDDHFDLFALTEINGLELGAAFQQWNEANGDGGEGIDTYGISAAYDFGMFELAADYSSSDSDIDTSDNNADQYNLAASFAANSDTTVAFGVTDTSYDNSVNEEDFMEYYGNITYKFPTQSNVRVFAEIKNTDLDGSDMGYLAGMRVKF